MLDPTQRFSNRVQNYVKYRPGYPGEIIPLLNSECDLNPEAVIADIGSGTGFLSELFLKNGNRVFGVEPNAEMRSAGEQLLAGRSNFTSIDGRAEATTLADNSVDFVTVGQAFHWFERDNCQREFRRILKSDGWLVIVWNGFQVERSPLIAGYQNLLLRYGTDFHDVIREIADSQVETFFAPGECKCARFAFQQIFDFEGLKGRLLSASYAPQPGETDYEPMLEELREVFEECQTDGKVPFDYDTVVYYGRFGQA